MQKKNNRTRQYLRDSVICLHPRNCRYFTSLRENIKSAVVQFLSKNNIKILIFKIIVFNILAQDSHWATKRGQKPQKISAPWINSQKISN